MWDTVVFDMPASGHAVSMLRVPWVIVDTVPEGPLTRDARTVKELLTDPQRTAAVLVTLAEEMPVNEAIELETKLTDARHRPAAHHRQPGATRSTSRRARRSSRVLDTLAADPRAAPPLARSRSTRACRAIAARSTRTTSPSCASARRRRCTSCRCMFTPTLEPGARAHARRAARQRES